MPNSLAQTFITALQALEADGDVEPLADLFEHDSTCDNVTATDPHRGVEGARTFWRADRDLFESISSDFRNVVVADNVIALEWLRTGTARGGSPVRYEGASIIEPRGQKIARFQAYYDPAALGAQTP